MSKLDGGQLYDDDDWLYGAEENSSSNIAKEANSQQSDTISTKTIE